MIEFPSIKYRLLLRGYIFFCFQILSRIKIWSSAMCLNIFDAGKHFTRLSLPLISFFRVIVCRAVYRCWLLKNKKTSNVNLILFLVLIFTFRSYVFVRSNFCHIPAPNFFRKTKILSWRVPKKQMFNFISLPDRYALRSFLLSS